MSIKADEIYVMFKKLKDSLISTGKTGNIQTADRLGDCIVIFGIYGQFDGLENRFE